MIVSLARTDFAIVIGISQYPHLRALQGPVQDATEFEDWLINFANVPLANIRLIVSSEPPDPPESRPIQDEIDTAFEEIFDMASLMQTPRRLYVYFAGHGCSQAFRHLSLLMANASEPYLGYSLDTKDYHEGLAHLAYFPEQIFFYDCCRNYDRLVTGRGHPWTLPDPRDNPRDTSEVMQYILYGACFTEWANERVLEYSTRRGLFTKALMEGLTQWGIEQTVLGDWVVTTDSLYPYVKFRLDELAEAENVKQKLAWNPAGRNEKLILATVSSPGTYCVSVTTNHGGDVVVRDYSLREVARQQISDIPLYFYLPNGTYTFRVVPIGVVKTERIGPGFKNSVNL